MRPKRDEELRNVLWARWIVLAGDIQVLCCSLDTPAVTPGCFTAADESGVTCTLAAARPTLR